jgi:hypothetical protein
MNIEIQKKYKTQCGFKVEINQILERSLYPVIGRYFDGDYNEWIDERWMNDGRCDDAVIDNDLDLVEEL